MKDAKVLKKILSIVLAVAVVLGITTTVLAANISVGADKNMVNAGEDVTVTITLDETVSGPTVFQGILKYDTSLLTFKSYELGESYNYTVKNSTNKSQVQISAIDATSSGLTFNAGTVAIITFTAVKDATESHITTSLNYTSNIQNALGEEFDISVLGGDMSIMVAISHSWDSGRVTTEPTCTTAGVKTFTCTYEGCGATRTEAVPALGHDEVVDSAIDPTCTEAGKTEGSHCVRCGEILVAQNNVAALGHAWDEGTITIAPTYTTEGQKEYVCTNSGCTETKIEVLPVLPALESLTLTDAKGEKVGICISDNFQNYVYTATTTSETVTVNAVLKSETSTVTFNGEESNVIELEMGENILEILVSNSSGDELVYTITITREKPVLIGDVNGDDEVDALDANLVYAYYNEVIAKFPIED